MSLVSSQSEKNVSLAELAARIPNGASLALGGSFLHRGPFAFVRELVRQGKSDLEIIKQSPGYDIDLLCRAGVASRARAGIVALEGNFGLAPHYRKAVETGQLRLEEHACATLTAGLRAAAFGLPFQPCGGVVGSGLVELNQWQAITDPYGSGKSVYVIPAIQPDYAVIHANAVDALGNVLVRGTAHWDRIMTRAAKHVFVLAEQLIDTEEFQQNPELTLVPHFMVNAFSVLKGAAWPGSCWPLYEVDYPAVTRYLQPGQQALQLHLDEAPELMDEVQ